MTLKHRLIAAVAVVSFLSFLPVAHVATAPADAGARLNSNARLLAGLSPTHADHGALAQLPEWKEHSAAMQTSWTRFEKDQVTPLLAWRDATIPKDCPVSDTLFYPFSGPDFINMYSLFPNCGRYVMFGLEHIGTVPAVDKMGRERAGRLLAGVREALANTFARNYFITSHMSKQLNAIELNGVVPMFMIQMALTGVEIVSIEPLELERPAAAPPVDPQDPNAKPLRILKGVTIQFRQPGSANRQQLHYFSVDVSNKGLRHYPEFVSFIRDLGPNAAMVKSASYLMHINDFSRMRELLLGNAQFLVQDDTGVPYRELTKRGYNVKVFGNYQEPIPPFEGHFQQALADQYDAQKPRQLPFRFGYRRAKDGDERNNVMVAVRGATPARQSDAAGAGKRPATADRR